MPSNRPRSAFLSLGKQPGTAARPSTSCTLCSKDQGKSITPRGCDAGGQGASSPHAWGTWSTPTGPVVSAVPASEVAALKRESNQRPPCLFIILRAFYHRADGCCLWKAQHCAGTRPPPRRSAPPERRPHLCTAALADCLGARLPQALVGGSLSPAALAALSRAS